MNPHIETISIAFVTESNYAIEIASSFQLSKHFAHASRKAAQ